MANGKNDIENLELERQELNLLIKQGVRFEVTTKVARREKGLRGFFAKPVTIDETASFEIQEPTLSVLDRISAISLEMAIDLGNIQGEDNVILEAKQLSKNNAKRMARVVAIAVLGEEYEVTEINRFGIIKKRTNDKELDRLTDLFFHSIKPSKLGTITATITSISNLGDFINSMRLLSGARTTQPRKESIE